MCVTNPRKRYQAWMNSQKIHPIWLDLKDRELQSKYDLWARHHVYKMLTILTAVQFGFSIFAALSNHEKEFNEQALLLLHFGSLLGSMLLALLLIKLKLKFADYAMFFILAVRCMETFLVFYLIDASAPGFTLVDKKELADAVFYVALPA